MNPKHPEILFRDYILSKSHLKIMSSETQWLCTKIHMNRYQEFKIPISGGCPTYKNSSKGRYLVELERETLFVGKLTMSSPIDKSSYRTKI